MQEYDGVASVREEDGTEAGLGMARRESSWFCEIILDIMIHMHYNTFRRW